MKHGDRITFTIHIGRVALECFGTYLYMIDHTFSMIMCAGFTIQVPTESIKAR